MAPQLDGQRGLAWNLGARGEGLAFEGWIIEGYIDPLSVRHDPAARVATLEVEVLHRDEARAYRRWKVLQLREIPGHVYLVQVSAVQSLVSRADPEAVESAVMRVRSTESSLSIKGTEHKLEVRGDQLVVTARWLRASGSVTIECLGASWRRSVTPEDAGTGG